MYARNSISTKKETSKSMEDTCSRSACKSRECQQRQGVQKQHWRKKQQVRQHAGTSAIAGRQQRKVSASNRRNAINRSDISNKKGTPETVGVASNIREPEKKAREMLTTPGMPARAGTVATAGMPATVDTPEPEGMLATAWMLLQMQKGHQQQYQHNDVCQQQQICLK